MQFFASSLSIGQRILRVQLVGCAALVMAFGWLLSPHTHYDGPWMNYLVPPTLAAHTPLAGWWYRTFEAPYYLPQRAPEQGNRSAPAVGTRSGVTTFTYNPQTDDGKYLYQAADGTLQPFYNKSGAQLRAEFVARKAQETAAR